MLFNTGDMGRIRKKKEEEQDIPGPCMTFGPSTPLYVTNVL